MNHAPVPSFLGLTYATMPLLAVLAALAWSGLGQVRALAFAAGRMVAQLALLGVVLAWIFDEQDPWITAAAGLVMLGTSADAVETRQRRTDWPLRLQALAALAFGVLVVLAVATRLAMRVEPWYAPHVVLPLLGMILGNSVNGVALAAERLEGELRAGRELVELRLALGATARQAALPALRAAARAALTPTINGMMIAGIVAIPGMATGQILAGADVGVALRYQVLIYLGIAGTVGLSTLALLAMRLRQYFTPAHQLRADRLED